MQMKSNKFFLAILLALLLAQCRCEVAEDFSIRGQWTFRAGDEVLGRFLFVGTLEQGTLVDIDNPDGGGGGYTVAGTAVEFAYASTLTGGRDCSFSGEFTTHDRLQGTMNFAAPYPPFTWSAEAVAERS